MTTLNKDAINQVAKAMGGITISGVMKGSPCDLLGVRFGDILLSVNGKKTETWQDYIDAKDLRTDRKMDAVIFRNGRAMNLSLDFGEEKEHNPAVILGECAEMRLHSSSNLSFNGKPKPISSAN